MFVPWKSGDFSTPPLASEVCVGRRSRERNGVTLTTFPYAPLSWCHSSEKEGRRRAVKIRGDKKDALEVRGDMFPSPDNGYIMNGRGRTDGDEIHPFLPHRRRSLRCS